MCTGRLESTVSLHPKCGDPLVSESKDLEQDSVICIREFFFQSYGTSGMNLFRNSTGRVPQRSGTLLGFYCVNIFLCRFLMEELILYN